MIASRGAPSLTSEMTKLVAIAHITLRSRFRYLWDMIGSTLFLAVVMFVFVRLWTVTYQSSAGAGENIKDIALAGFSLAQMIWYLVATESIIMSMTPIHRHIEREIRDGDVAIRLNKPYSFLGFHWSVFLGEGLIKACILIAVGGFVAAVMVGGVAFSLTSVPALMLTYVLTSSLNFFFGAMIGLLAFWTEDVTGFYFIFDRVKWLLGGFLMPITLFPEWLLRVVEWLPFSLMIYQPARLAVQFEWNAWAELSMKQIGLILVLGLLAQGMYRLGVRRLDVNGG